MERLTFDGNFCDIAQCRNVPGGSFCEDGACYQKKVWERLKQFEDTVRAPELFFRMYGELPLLESAIKHYSSHDRMKELAKADKDGRVVLLPCRGDADIVLMRNGIAFKPDHWNIHLTAFAENQPTPSGRTVALFDLSEVQESMEGKKDG
jgi:hypothetical protein